MATKKDIPPYSDEKYGFGNEVDDTIAEPEVETIEVKFTSVIADIPVGHGYGRTVLAGVLDVIADYAKSGEYRFPNVTGGEGETVVTLENV